MTTPVQAWDGMFADRVGNMQASEIRELLKLLDQPDVVSFAGGIPDPALFPHDVVRRASEEILADRVARDRSLQYSVSEGYAPLRRWIAGHMGRLGVPCDDGNVLITCGSQQALDFLGKLLLSPGDTVLVTAPTYLGALQAFNAYEPRYDQLTLEGGNRTPSAFRDAAEAARSRIKLGYVVPDFANPSGDTLSRESREGLLDLADELGTALVEDGAYSALRYDGAEQPSLLALDVRRSGSIEAARTIYCGTFSKTLAPALRVGWICGPPAVIEKLVLMKQAADLHSATFNQMVVHRVAESAYHDQIDKIRAVYRRRRDALLEALRRHMPDGVTWTNPEGGMFVWLTLPPGLDAAALLERAVSEARVAFVPGKAFFADGSGANTLRLSFSLVPEDKVDPPISRLGALVADSLVHNPVQAR